MEAVQQKKPTEPKHSPAPAQEKAGESTSVVEEVGAPAGLPLFLKGSPNSFGAADSPDRSDGGGQAIQCRMTVSQPNDEFEQEADRTADAVMRMPEPTVQRAPT